MIIAALWLCAAGTAGAAAPRAAVEVVRPELAPLPAPLVPFQGLGAVSAASPSLDPAKTDAMAGLSSPMDGLAGQLEKGGSDGLSASAGADFMSRIGQPVAPGLGGGGAGDGWAPEWQRGSFAAADGARLSYLYRSGSGPAVLMVHGRTLGADSFTALAEKSFPGRPMMLLERRGYGRSEVGSIDEKTIGAVEAGDVDRAIAVAQDLGGGAKVGVLAYSLGAMVLPPIDPARVAWLALLNPGVGGMLRHMTPGMQAGAQWLRAGYEAARWSTPWQKDAFITMAVEQQLGILRRRVAERSGKESALGGRLLDDFEHRMKDRRLRELWVQETLWAGFGPHSELKASVPVLLFLNRGDETVPKAAYRELLKSLRGAAPRVRVKRAPGGHLAPVFEPDALREALEDFDRVP
ncbi:MAG: alpha/beta hydrolase [Elusimicrobia bacterium]|nr:alpha/beta hydrolase [Elusimicrobiota bacterium]